MEQATVAVFGSSAAVLGDAQYQAALRCGRLLAEAGFAVVTGGYGGVMEAVSSGARGAGAPVVGVTVPTVFPQRPGPNPYVTDERQAASLTERIHQLISIPDAIIALEGSIGTFTELMAAWNVAFAARFSGTWTKPVVAVGPQWRELLPLLAEKLETDGSLITCVDTVEEAVTLVKERLSVSD
ncbi:MAG: LOG family protein [Acidimicrobiia bacterium]